MKTKKSLYILIPLVILIWGYIAWQIIDKRSDKSAAIKSMGITRAVKADSIKFNYEIMLNYHDPFLRNTPTIRKPDKKSRNNSFTSIRVKNISTYSAKPTLTYHGYILFGNKKTALIEYSGKNFLLNEKDITGDLKVNSISSDSIIILYHDKKFCYDKTR